MKRYALLDVETTGGSSRVDRVIDVGIALVDGLTLVDTWSSLVNPERNLSPFIEAITGISNALVKTAPTFDQLLGPIQRLLQDRILVAHNVAFDFGFMQQEFERFGLSFVMPRVCSVRLSRQFYPEYRHHNLDCLIDRFQLEIDNRHRALPDALLIYQLFNRFAKDFGAKTLEGLVDKLTIEP